MLHNFDDMNETDIRQVSRTTNNEKVY